MKEEIKKTTKKVEKLENENSKIQTMNIYEKLINIQLELKAPKNQRNTFGNYNFRSCEDILESVKGLNHKYRVLLLIEDEVVNIENRFYIKANCKLVNIDNPSEIIINTALAREPESKPKFDDSQVTGSSSSYARKYALNGLYSIDDNKDADTNEFANQSQGELKIEKDTKSKTTKTSVKKVELINASDKEEITKLAKDNNDALNLIKETLKECGVNKISELSCDKGKELLEKIKGL